MTFQEISEKIKAGVYINALRRPARKESSAITDSTRSVDWNRQWVSEWNKCDYPRLNAEFEAEEARVKSIFEADLISAFTDFHADITPIRARKLYELAKDNGGESYWSVYNSDGWREAPNWYAYVLSEAELLAGIFSEE